MPEQKFQLRYSASEDRVLIMAGTSAEDMRCFALTRRMVRRLWPGLNRVITMIAPSLPQPETATTAGPAESAGPAAKQPPQTPPAGAMPAANPAANPAADAAPETNPDDVLGAPPPPEQQSLVRKLQLVDRGPQMRLLVLTANDSVLRVPLDDRQLVQVYDALRTVIRRADWSIDLDEGLPDSAAEATGDRTMSIDITADSPSRYRH
jgi:hypothetical protein